MKTAFYLMTLISDVFCSIDVLLSDLSRLFNEALALRDQRGGQGDDNEEYLGVYAQGKQLSVKLAKVPKVILNEMKLNMFGV